MTTETTEQPPEQVSWTCEECGFVAVSERGLKKHITQSHSEAPPDTPEEEKVESEPPISEPDEQPGEDGDSPVECYKCGRTLAMKDAIEHPGREGVPMFWCGMTDCTED